MAVTVKYSSIFFLVAAVSLTVIILLGVLDYYGTHNLIINYCQSAGFRYEERLFRGLWRGYCIFDNVNCLSADCYLGGNCISDIDAVDIVYSTSECFAVDFFRGGCTPCYSLFLIALGLRGLRFVLRTLSLFVLALGSGLLNHLLLKSGQLVMPALLALIVSRQR